MFGWLHLRKDPAPYRHGPRTVNTLELKPRDNVADLIFLGETSAKRFGLHYGDFFSPLPVSARFSSRRYESALVSLQVCCLFLPVRVLPVSPVKRLKISMILRSVTDRAPLWGLSLAGTMLVVACAGGPLTTREKGTLGGAALGAGAGAIIGGATGGGAGKGALIG